MTALALVLALATTGTAPPAAERPKAIVLDIKASAGSEDIARAVTNILAVELQRLDRFDVVTAADVRALVEQEATRQQLGCDVTATSCLAEIAGALGAELAFYGEASTLGALTVVTINFFDAKENRARGRTAIEVQNAADVPAAVRRALPELLDEQSPLLGPLGVTGAVVGGAGLVAGGAGVVWTALMSGIESSTTSSRADKELAFGTHTAMGVVALAGGAALVVGAGLVVADLVLE